MYFVKLFNTFRCCTMTLCEQINDVIELLFVPESRAEFTVLPQIMATELKPGEFTIKEEGEVSLIRFGLSLSSGFASADFQLEMDNSPEVKVVSEVTKAGIQKKCTIKLVCSDYSDQVDIIIRNLERAPHHVIMYRQDGRKYLVRYIPFAYSCTSEDNSDTKTISFELTNINGMQKFS